MIFDPHDFDYIAEDVASGKVPIIAPGHQFGTLGARRGASPDTHLTVSGSKAALTGVLLRPDSATALVKSGAITLDGDAGEPASRGSVLDEFDPAFPIVTP